MSFHEQTTKPVPDYFAKKNNTPRQLFILPEHWQAMLYRVFNLRNCLFFLMVALAFIAWNRGLALLYGVVAMLFSLLVVSAILPWLYVRRVQFKQFNAAPVHVGQMQTLAIALNAKKRVHCIVVTVPQAMAKFVMPSLGGQLENLQVDYFPQHRGHWLVSQCLFECGYPLGIVNAKQSIAVLHPSYLTVYPRLFQIKKIPLNWLNADSHNDVHPQRQRKGDDLFMGLRDYRVGDAYRAIDWRATARSNDIKVREFEHLAQPSFLMVINASNVLNVGDGERNAFEQQLIIAASLATFLIEQGWRVTVAGACVMQLTNTTQLVDFYQQLAELTAAENMDYRQQVQEAIGECGRASVVLSFDTQAVTLELGRSEQKHWQFIFNRESYLKPLATYPKSHLQVVAHGVVIPVLASDKLEGVFGHD